MYILITESNNNKVQFSKVVELKEKNIILKTKIDSDKETIKELQ